MMKSFQAICLRSSPLPSSMNFLLGLGVVDEDDVGVAAPRGVERLAGAERQHVHGDPGRLGEFRQDRAEQSRIVDRGGRGQGDGLLRGVCASAPPAENSASVAIMANHNLRIPTYLPVSNPSARPATKALAQIIVDKPISTMPRPSASGRLPLLVSSTIAVVIVRV